MFGAATVGIVLTGMGRDGAQGLRVVRARGGHALVQSPDSAVVAGMPDAALDAAGADVVGPPVALAEALATLLAGTPALERESPDRSAPISRPPIRLPSPTRAGSAGTRAAPPPTDDV